MLNDFINILNEQLAQLMINKNVLTEHEMGANQGQYKFVILLILAMGNFTGFQKSDDFYIHPRLGQIKRIQKEDGPQLIEHIVMVDSQDTVINWLKIMSGLQNTQIPSLLFLPKSHFYQRVGYCGSICEVFLLYDDFMFCLKDQIINRKLIKRHFPESSVWQILLKLTKACKQLQKQKLKIGNVKTQNIVVNEQGQFRIVSQYSWPNNNEHNFIDTQLKQKLYSPQQLDKIQHTILRKTKSCNIQKHSQIKQQSNQDQTLLTQQVIEEINNQEIFSIGATLLQICTLQPSIQLYGCVEKEREKERDKDKIREKEKDRYVQEKEISRRLALLDGKYSHSFISMLAQMLKINPQERLCANDILQLLADHETSIMKHQTFTLFNFTNDSFANRGPNSSLGSEGKSNTQNGKQNGDRWGNLTMFFPFLRNMYEGKKFTKTSKSNSSTGLSKQFSLTKAH